MTPRDLTISAKLTLTTTAMVLFVFALISLILLWAINGLYQENARQLRSLQEASDTTVSQQFLQKSFRSLEAEGTLLAELVAHTPGDTAQLSPLVALVEQDPEFANVDIRDPQGNSLIGRTPTAAAPGEHRDFPIERDGQLLGTVVLGLDPHWKEGLDAQQALEQRLQNLLAANSSQREVALGLTIALLILSAFLIGIVIYLAIARLSLHFILAPANHIRNALGHMEQQRDFSERLTVDADDELGRAVAAFNSGIEFLERENDQLNDSIIELLAISNDISRTRNLDLTIPVKDDITGPLRDALNRITSESARVLLQVRDIAERVGQAAARVQAQGHQVIEVAHTERQEIERTTNDLQAAVAAVDHIADLAHTCNDAAEQANDSTNQALTSVKEAVEGMDHIRQTIQDTGARIKRLGERSQEISSIVDIINSFSERTHVLAINAAMQASMAGNAGRGFAVVAQEVQRLADSSRNATGQIASLIANIQIETQDSIQTVNQASESVGTESQNIEEAGERMVDIQHSSTRLSEAINQINERAQAQVGANRKLMERVERMRASTLETTDELDRQAEETNSLVDYAAELRQAIQLFRLPQALPAANGPAH